MHRQHHKMHIGEIMFHIAVPLTMFLVVGVMGYYITLLVLKLLKMA